MLPEENEIRKTSHQTPEIKAITPSPNAYHLKLHDRVLRRIHERPMKTDIRGAKLLVRQRFVLLKRNFGRHAVQFGLGASLYRKANAHAFEFVACFGYFGQVEHAQADHEGDGRDQVL